MKRSVGTDMPLIERRSNVTGILFSKKIKSKRSSYGTKGWPAKSISPVSLG